MRKPKAIHRYDKLREEFDRFVKAASKAEQQGDRLGAREQAKKFEQFVAGFMFGIRQSLLSDHIAVETFRLGNAAIKDVHTEHCCIDCGCKYGENETCTVVRRIAPPSYPRCALCQAFDDY